MSALKAVISDENEITLKEISIDIGEKNLSTLLTSFQTEVNDYLTTLVTKEDKGISEDDELPSDNEGDTDDEEIKSPINIKKRSEHNDDLNKKLKV